MISQAFREYAYRKNGEAGGAQNAHLRVVLLEFTTDPPTRGVYLDSAVNGQGQHTEERLIADFWAKLAALNIAPNVEVRLCRVEIFSRFNTCLGCTGALVEFSDQLKVRLTNGHAAAFDVALGGNLYLPVEGNAQISIAEGAYRREAESTTLRLNGWTVERGNLVTTVATLGTENDPIVLM